MQTLLRDDGFWVAVVVAAIAVAVSVLAARRPEVETTAPLPFGAVVVGAACFAAAVDVSLSFALLLGLLLVALSGHLVARGAGRLWAGAALAVGAGFVAASPQGIASWMRVVGFVAVLVVVPCAAVLDRRVPRLLPVLAAITAVGVYVCVPDTETPLVVLGASLPAVLLALDPTTEASPWTGAFVALVVEAVLIGGEARAGAIVGGLACVGVLLVAPCAWWVPRARRAGWWLVGVHAVLVLWVSRVAGFRDSAWVAVALCVPAFALAWIVLFVAGRVGARAPRQ